MANTPAFENHYRHVLGLSPELARQLVEDILTALREAGADVALAQDRNQLFQVSEAIAGNPRRLEAALEASLVATIEASHNMGAGGKPHLDDLHIDELTLVDEDQAEIDIEISRTVQLIELSSEWEWRELQALSATLQGEITLRPEANPFRPVIYAQAFSKAIQSLALPPGPRNMLLRLGGKALAKRLQALYAQVCNRLQHLGISPLAYRAVTNPRPASSQVDITQPGALSSLVQRIPESSSAAQALSPTERKTLGLLSGLFSQMLADTELQPGIKRLIGQLETSVSRMAQHDPRLLRSAQHPAWRLINEVASYATGYEDADSAQLQQFQRFLEPLIEQLSTSPAPLAEQYEDAISQVQDFIEQQDQAQLKPRQQSMTRLERADQEQTLMPILRQQVRQQLAANPVVELVQHFLTGPWVEVLAKVMTQPEHDDKLIQSMLHVVDDLLHSLQRPTTLAERDALRQNLPDLIERLRKGMALIDMPTSDRGALLDELRGIHGRYLRAMPKPARELTPEELVQQMRDEMASAPADSGFDFDIERPAMNTSVGDLPTIPMGLGDEDDNLHIDDNIDRWLDSLRSGAWYKLFIDGQWTTARLLWASGNRRFFVFTRNKTGGMHALSKGALERLRKEGLATSLEDRSLMQRAVDSLMQDLDD